MQRASVLIVDDEPDVLSFLVDLLEVEGYAVDTASAGMEALIRVHLRAYDAVLLDVLMPGLTGLDFYRALERGDPMLCGRVIFMTGDTGNPEGLDRIARTGAPVLLKPFAVEEVLRILKRVVDS